MHLRKLLPLAVPALLASAIPQIFPPFAFPTLPAGPVSSIVSNSLATATIASQGAAVVTPVIPSAVASAVAAAPAVPQNTSTDLIPGLEIPPTKLYDNVLAAIAILYDVLTLLNDSGLVNAPTVKTRDLDLPSIAGLQISGGLGATITTLIGVVIPLLSLTL